MEFKEGSYYEVQWFNKRTTVKWFFKFKYISDIYIYVYYLVFSDKTVKKNESFEINDDDIFIEITYEDFINQFPRNHPEKIEFRKQRINKLLNGI